MRNEKGLSEAGISLAEEWEHKTRVSDKMIAIKLLTNITRVSERMIVIKLLVQDIIIQVISFYAPECDLDDSQNDIF